MENTRTGNVLRNVSWATLLQFILMLLQFITRTVFIRTIGRDYLGITGFFTDIMLVIDLANLRIPDALILCMYKPLAEKNYVKVRAIINIFGKACFFISIAIFTVGIAIIPFLSYLIKDPPNIPENFTVMYLFYLFTTIVTYFVYHRSSLIFADQKNYIVSIYQKAFHFIQIILQIVILIFIRNFYFFILAQVVTVPLMNFMLSRKAEKMYPFIKEKNTYKLSKIEKTEIITTVKSMFIYGIGAVALVGVDSILVSSIIGIGVLGLCTNYMLIINSVKALIDQSMIGFTASIGNLNVQSDSETTETAFCQVNFIVFFITAFCAINLAISLSTLVSVWLDASFILPQMVVISLVLRFYVQGTLYTTFTFRSTLGLLNKKRYISILTAIVNIALSIVMGKFYGVAGIFFASSIAIFFFTILPEAVLLYKEKFQKSNIKFFISYFKYLAFMVCNYLITKFILDKMEFNGWTGFLLKAFLGAVISGSFFIIVFFRDKYFREIYYRLLYMIKSRKAE